MTLSSRDDDDMMDASLDDESEEAAELNAAGMHVAGDADLEDDDIETGPVKLVLPVDDEVEDLLKKIETPSLDDEDIDDLKRLDLLEKELEADADLPDVGIEGEDELI